MPGTSACAYTHCVGVFADPPCANVISMCARTGSMHSVSMSTSKRGWALGVLVRVLVRVCVHGHMVMYVSKDAHTHYGCVCACTLGVCVERVGISVSARTHYIGVAISGRARTHHAGQQLCNIVSIDAAHRNVALAHDRSSRGPFVVEPARPHNHV